MTSGVPKRLIGAAEKRPLNQATSLTSPEAHTRCHGRIPHVVGMVSARRYMCCKSGRRAALNHDGILPTPRDAFVSTKDRDRSNKLLSGSSRLAYRHGPNLSGHPSRDAVMRLACPGWVLSAGLSAPALGAPHRWGAQSAKGGSWSVTAETSP